MFNAILWDMDGTIIDTERLVWLVIKGSFKDVAGVDLPENLFEALLGQSEADFYRNMGRRYSLKPERIAAIKAAFDKDYIPMLFDVPALPGAVEKVAEFQGKAPQALVTGSTSAQAAAVIESLQLADRFKHVVACDHYNRGKPDPEPYVLAAQKLGVDPSSCLVLEDSPSGVTAAKKAGMKVVGIRQGNKGKYNIKHADLEIDSLTDLDWDKLVAHFS